MLREFRKYRKGVLQTAKISKLEQNFSNSPSQLEFGGEHLFWGTAREVLVIPVIRSLNIEYDHRSFKFIALELTFKLYLTNCFGFTSGF